MNLTKARLETEIDTLPYDVKYRDKKLNDLNLRLEKMYDAIAEVEEYIVNAWFEKKALEKEKTTLENIRRILLNFSELFDIMNEQEQKNLLMYFVKEINLNPYWEKKSPLKSIEFNFPIYEDSEETVFMCEEKSSVEMVYIQKSYPHEVKPATSLVYDYVSEQGNEQFVLTYTELKPFDIAVQTIERTLVDKVFAVCDYKIDGRIYSNSRHIYDLRRLLDRIVLGDSLKALVKEVRADRKNMKDAILHKTVWMCRSCFPKLYRAKYIVRTMRT